MRVKTLQSCAGHRRTATCLALHAAIVGYCRALLDCGLISAAQQKKLIDEAGLELANWQSSTETHHHASD
jgi:hypothetical protein